MANPQVTIGGGLVAVPKDAATRNATAAMTANTINILSAAGVILASAAFANSGSNQVLNVGNFVVQGTFTQNSSNVPANVQVSANAGQAAAAGLAVAVAGYGSSTVPAGSYTFDTVAAGGGGATIPTTAPAITATSQAGYNAVGLAVADANNYVDVYKGTAAGAESATPFASFAPNTTGTVNDTTAVIGSLTYYTAKLRNAAGSGPASAEVSATATQAQAGNNTGNASNVVAVTPGPAVSAMTNLTGFRLNTAAALNWTNPAGALTGAQVNQRVQVAAGQPLNAWASAATLPATTAGNPATVPNNTTITGLTNGVTYEFEVLPLS